MHAYFFQILMLKNSKSIQHAWSMRMNTDTKINSERLRVYNYEHNALASV